MKKWKLIITFLVLIFAMSCSPGKKRSEMPGAKLNLSLFPIKTSNNEPAIEGGTLQVAMVKDDPLVGVFNEVLYTDGYDGDIISTFLSSGIFEVDENIRFRLNDAGHMLRICNCRIMDNRRSEKQLKLYFQEI